MGRRDHRHQQQDVGSLRHMTGEADGYRPMMLVGLGRHLASAESESHRRRLVLEFVEEYRGEPSGMPR